MDNNTPEANSEPAPTDQKIGKVTNDSIRSSSARKIVGRGNGRASFSHLGPTGIRPPKS
jgi:hypothetical protein